MAFPVGLALQEVRVVVKTSTAHVEVGPPCLYDFEVSVAAGTGFVPGVKMCTFLPVALCKMNLH